MSTSACLYHAGDHRWACTCQPPTIWGASRMWHCDCCEQPRAERKFTLCPVCLEHEYAHPVTVQADHDDMDDFDALDSAPPGAGSGAFVCPELA